MSVMVFAAEDISKSKLEVSANLFEVDMQNNQFIAEKDVKIKQGDLLILADKANYTDIKEVINLHNNIEVFYKKLKINCQEMVYNRKKFIITASGKLKVYFEDISIEGKELQYDINKNIGYFHGKTVIHKKENLINGSDIVFDMNTKKIYSKEETKFTLDKIQ